jgi:hypothetical protein
VYVLRPFEPFEHEQVWVTHGEMQASVDVAFAKLIPALWREGKFLDIDGATIAPKSISSRSAR